MKTDNMPSLRRVLDLLTPVRADELPRLSGMDATVRRSVRITGTTCPRMGEKALPNHCSVTGTQECPSDQAAIDNCPTC